MSEDRFSFLISCLRFDDKDTREERRQTDRFAPIRKICYIFIEKFGKMYFPKETLTVDEQLLEFRGNCPFRMYIRSKPTKYGIKLDLINDSNSKYLIGGIPYLGKRGTRLQDGITLGHELTKELTMPYHHTKRNVTIDNWLSSVPLSTDLLVNCGMTHVGTLKANKKVVPVE
ncbi:hypothetical protein Pcinc_020442 [Petrolisthes cinctipes]|uniref:PiggyBac transposable element-derived protein domain-containing protein n=1 Tax=Petrolisthes cinctipes TaxID=88211 RepID=A0AAE1FK73_PETCI|nr:hypothetical protein Pcinc_020442 [Petrolisthes cinctipes]